MNLELNGNKLLIVVLLLLLLSMFKYFNHTDNTSLTDRKWILSAYRAPNGKIRKPLKKFYYLEFYEFFSLVKIDVNCFHQAEKYTIRDNKIDILYRTYYTYFYTTLQPCPEYDYSKQYKEESAFISHVMVSEFVYSIQDGQLILTSPDGKQLLFSEAEKYQRLGFVNQLGTQLFIWLEDSGLMPMAGSFLGFIYRSRYYILAGFAVYMYWNISNRLFK